MRNYNNELQIDKKLFLQSVLVESKKGKQLKFTYVGLGNHSQRSPEEILENNSEFAIFAKQILDPLVKKSSLSFKIKIFFDSDGYINYDKIDLEFMSHEKVSHFSDLEVIRHTYYFNEDIQHYMVYSDEHCRCSLSSLIQTSSDKIEEFLTTDPLIAPFDTLNRINAMLENHISPCEKLIIPVQAGRVQILLASTQYSYTVPANQLLTKIVPGLLDG
ncbi:hypothetical protein [Kurthia gibsonii]|uniref:hypothetical protein n=1 Tax=Kurthia gibsonii TaxID=33946 RepID=UPI002DB647AF|nr:hypothetical protein [Kurthia gibsonii]MEB7773583.1 hypothetical protein [Kurthia gibsonii]